MQAVARGGGRCNQRQTFSAPMPAEAATSRRGWPTRRSIASGSLRLQYLAGLAANMEQRFLIFQSMLAYRRYPADLFVASAELEAQLRSWYAMPASRARHAGVSPSSCRCRSGVNWPPAMSCFTVSAPSFSVSVITTATSPCCVVWFHFSVASLPFDGHVGDGDVAAAAAAEHRRHLAAGLLDASAAAPAGRAGLRWSAPSHRETPWRPAPRQSPAPAGRRTPESISSCESFLLLEADRPARPYCYRRQQRCRMPPTGRANAEFYWIRTRPRSPPLIASPPVARPRGHGPQPTR